ncbi:hypothetical protein, partial [Rhodococcus erythropolis]|uniref:hypothetical protein n=1 Tax=Rhodococcus erythropolis TaxID=1833 RepID=UPI003B00BED5
DGQPPGFGGLLVSVEGGPVAGEFGGGPFGGDLGHAGQQCAVAAAVPAINEGGGEVGQVGAVGDGAAVPR